MEKLAITRVAGFFRCAYRQVDWLILALFYPLAVSLGASIARHGKKVLILDADSQHSATVSLGVAEPDKLTVTLAIIMHGIIGEQ